MCSMLAASYWLRKHLTHQVPAAHAAGAVAKSAPASAVSQGASVAKGGQTVATQCNAYAKDSVQYRTCVAAAAAWTVPRSDGMCNMHPTRRVGVPPLVVVPVVQNGKMLIHVGSYRSVGAVHVANVSWVLHVYQRQYE